MPDKEADPICSCCGSVDAPSTFRLEMQGSAGSSVSTGNICAYCSQALDRMVTTTKREGVPLECSIVPLTLESHQNFPGVHYTLSGYLGSTLTLKHIGYTGDGDPHRTIRFPRGFVPLSIERNT